MRSVLITVKSLRAVWHRNNHSFRNQKENGAGLRSAMQGVSGFWLRTCFPSAGLLAAIHSCHVLEEFFRIKSNFPRCNQDHLYTPLHRNAYIILRFYNSLKTYQLNIVLILMGIYGINTETGLSRCHEWNIVDREKNI